MNIRISNIEMLCMVVIVDAITLGIAYVVSYHYYGVPLTKNNIYTQIKIVIVGFMIPFICGTLYIHKRQKDLEYIKKLERG